MKKIADSLSHENTSNTIVLEERDDQNGVEREDKFDRMNQDSREPSRRQKKYMLEDDAGLLSPNRGDESLFYPEHNKNEDDNEIGSYQQRRRRGIYMSDVYNVQAVADKFGPRLAQNMLDKGIEFVDAALFDEAYEQSMASRTAETNFEMSKDYAKDEKGLALVNYYDNWDVEWALYAAKDYNKKGERLGVFMSADKARQEANSKGDGNYVIEGECVRPEKSHWGYYVVSVKNGMTTRYSKKPVYVHETHAGYRKASSNIIEISPEEFMSETITAGRIVRARLSKKSAAAIRGFAKYAQKMLDNVGVTSKSFPEGNDRRSMREVLASLDKCMDSLQGMVDSLSPGDQKKLDDVVETLEEVCHTDLDHDSEMGEPQGHVSQMGGGESPGDAFSGDSMMAYAALSKLNNKEQARIVAMLKG